MCADEVRAATTVEALLLWATSAKCLGLTNPLVTSGPHSGSNRRTSGRSWWRGECEKHHPATIAEGLQCCIQ